MPPNHSAPRLRVSFLAIGDELLSGRAVDTNGAMLGKQMVLLGHELFEKRMVPDDLARIGRALTDLAQDTDVIVVSGGLGPTPDDLTREAVAAWAGVDQDYHEALWDTIVAKFADRGRTPTENNRRQAYLPRGAKAIDNPRGSAPGFDFQTEQVRLVSLPGVPAEFEGMVTDYVIPSLFAAMPRRRHFLHLHGIAESKVTEAVDQHKLVPPFIDWGTQSSPMSMTVRLDMPEEDPAAWWLVMQERFQEVFTDRVFGKDEDTIYSVLLDECLKQEATLAVAESCTGGLLAEKLTAIPGSSAVFRGGLVAYHNDVKQNQLHVPAAILETDGAVSAPVARVMATEVRQLLGADLSASITGVAGPGGGTEAKPVGLVYTAASFGRQPPKAQRHNWPGDRKSIRDRSAGFAAFTMWRLLRGFEVHDDLA